MGRRCTACEHPARESLNRDLRSGLAHRQVADRYGLSFSAVLRHRNNHVLGRPDPVVPRPAAKPPPKPKAKGNPARDLKHDQMAFAYANGESVVSIAKRFGHNYTYAWVLLHKPHMQERIQGHVKSLQRAEDMARARIKQEVVELVDQQLDIALGKDVKIDDAGREFEVYRYPAALRLKAAKGLLDRVLPAVARPEAGEQSAHPSAEILQKINERLAEEQRNPRPRLDFENSPHIHSGQEALPKGGASHSEP